jgi:hypothetical protein
MYIIDRIYFYLPFKNLFVPRLLKSKNDGIPIIGTTVKSIPGFTHKDSFKIIKIVD